MLVGNVAIGEQFVHFLNLRTDHSQRICDLVGAWRDAEFLRYALSHGLIKILPEGGRVWLGAADAAKVDFAAMLAEHCEAVITLGPAGSTKADALADQAREQRRVLLEHAHDSFLKGR